MSNPAYTLGRGQALKKLQTDLPTDDDHGPELPSDIPRGADESSEFGPGFDDDDEYYYSSRYGRNEPPSKSFTAEEEMAVVKKFDRRLTLFMALLYMLSFLDRSSESDLRFARSSWDFSVSEDANVPLYRHRKCKGCRHDGRSQTHILTI